MIGIYFSGTGNTKYCLENFVALYDRNIEITNPFRRYRYNGKSYIS